jgi:predicted lipoprotein
MLIIKIIITAAGVVALLLLPACPPPAPADIPERRPMLASIGENVILPTYRAFSERAASLSAATSALVSALGTADEAARRAAAQQAWREAMAVWQRAELMQIGPAGMAGRMVGGESLRDEIYSWPTVNTCRVDQELVAHRFEEPGFFDTALVNVYTLAALEHLLFHEAPQNTCPAQATINTDGSWAALSPAELSSRRARYARAAAAYLHGTAQALVTRWEPEGGAFVHHLATAGQAGSAYPTARVAVDDLFAALFYLDLKVKDEKVAVPAGISPSCLATTCPEALESRQARHSKQNLIENLSGFREVLVGHPAGAPEQLGFDDWLAERGAPELATELVQGTDGAIASLQAISGTLEDSLARGPAELEAVHAQIKALTDAMKTQFVSILGLRVPAEGSSDND